MPHEVLHHAVNESLKRSDGKVAKFMEKHSSIDLSAAPFFKLVFNIILDIKSQMWSQESFAQNGITAFMHEAARLFNSVLI